VMNTITSSEGGIFSAEDADSLLEHGKPDHAEGAFYVWKYEEIVSIIGEHDANVFNHHYGVEKKGNTPPGSDPHGEFKGKNILIQRYSIEETASQFQLSGQQVEELLANARKKLFEVREKRPRPHLDDKIITAWNGLMISAYSRGSQVLNDPKYLEAAKRAARFIRDKLYNPATGLLIRNYREGPSNIEGFTDDYAFLICSLLDLYEASFEVEWLKWAIVLQKKQDEIFWDDQNGGYFSVKSGDDTILLRMKEDYDGAEPSNNSFAVMNLLRLSQMTGSVELRTQAEKSLKCFSNPLTNQPIMIPHMCAALDFFLSSPKQIIIAGKRDAEDTNRLLKEIHSHLIPNKVVLLADDAENQQFLADKISIMKDIKMIGGKATAYVCEHFTCQLPVTEVKDLNELLIKK